MERVCPECGTKTDELTCPEDGEMTLVIKQETQEDTLVGKVIGGRYRITKLVGQGGFGGVYSAEHTATGDTLAIKVLRADVENNKDVIMRFRQEAKQTSKLKHPNTVRVYDFGQMDDGNLFLAMEFLVGSELTDVMRKEGPLSYKRVIRICIQVLKSLSEAHSKGLVHRDLKPDNIFLQDLHGEQDFVRVLDFGIAKSLSDEQQDITSTGAVIGTPKYMSPEQARGQPVDERTDIYSLGVILFELLSGAPPFVAETPLAMILRRVTEEPPRIHDNVALPTPLALCDVTLKSLAKNPADRYQSADEFAKALEGVLETATTEPLVQPGAAGGAAHGGGGSTASYGAGAMGGGDETAAFDGSNITSDVQVMVSGQFDDATVAASADEIALAAAQQGDATITTAAPSGPPPGGDGGATVVAQLPVSSAPVGGSAVDQTAVVHQTGSNPALGAMGSASQTQIPMQAMPPQPQKSTAPWAIFAMGAVAVVVGFVLFGLVNKQSVNAPAGSGTAANAPVKPAAVAAAQTPPPPPAQANPAPAPAPPPAPAKPTTAQLKIVRTPTDAIVAIYGLTIPNSETILQPGEHMVVAQKQGFKPYQQKITLKAGDKQTVTILLEELPKKKAAPRPRRPARTGGSAPKPQPKPKPKPSGGLLID